MLSMLIVEYCMFGVNEISMFGRKKAWRAQGITTTIYEYATVVYGSGDVPCARHA